MDAKALRLRDLVSLAAERCIRERTCGWGIPQIAGRFVEISGAGASAKLTAAFGLVVETQRSGEPAAWITLPQSTFFPPDAAESGVDLDALAVVRAPDARAAARAADHLIRSGAFGLVVVDLGPTSTKAPQSLPAPLQTRLAGLAQKHETAVVVLTEKPVHAHSLGSLVSLRAEARRVSESRTPAEGPPTPVLQEVQVVVLKDKRRGPGRIYREICHGPAGLR